MIISGRGVKTAADTETPAKDNEIEMFIQAGTPVFRKKKEGLVRFS
jgi:hypothetical protein